MKNVEIFSPTPHGPYGFHARNQVREELIAPSFLILSSREVDRGTQRPNVSKYTRSVSNGFLCALEACLVNLELP